MKLREIPAARQRALASGRVEPCHWSEGCWGVTVGNASHNASNARGVTAGKILLSTFQSQVATSDSPFSSDKLLLPCISSFNYLLIDEANLRRAVV